MKFFIHVFSILMCLSTFSQNWEVSYDNSIKRAKEESKKLLVVFQGSDWCGPCIKLSKEIWSTEFFIDYSDKSYVMLQVDFPRRKKNSLSESQKEQNAVLAEKFNPRGYFPFVVVLNSSGKLIGEIGYENTTPQKFIEIIESFEN